MLPNQGKISDPNLENPGLGKAAEAGTEFSINRSRRLKDHQCWWRDCHAPGLGDTQVLDSTGIRNLLASEPEGTGKCRIQQEHGVPDGHHRSGMSQLYLPF